MIPSAMGMRFALDPVALVITCGIYILIVLLNRNHTYPILEEISFASATISDAWAGWFTRGFSQYFLPYDDWSLPLTSSIKPVDNLAYWLVYELTPGWSYHNRVLVYFLVFCVAAFCGARLVYRCLIEFGVRGGAARFASWLCLLTPAVVAGLNCYSYQFDAAAGFLVLAAFYSLWRGRTALTLACLFLGVFTKEIVLTAPVAAALSCWLLQRRLIKGFVMLAPLCVWLALYLVAFGQSSLIDRATGSASLAGTPSRLAHGLFFWPLGVTDVQILRDVTVGYGAFDGMALMQCGLLGLNLLLWIVLVSAFIPLGRRYLVSPARLDGSERAFAYAMIWLCGALAMGVIAAQSNPRYGGWIHPALLVAGATCWNTPFLRTPASRCALTLASLLVVSALAVSDIRAYADLDVVPPPATEALHSTLLSLGPQPNSVYVINAPDVSTPEFLRQAWGLPFELRLVSHFEGCTKGFGGSTSAEDDILRVTIPDCAKMGFYSVSPDRLLAAITGEAYRDGIGTYHFPDGKIVGHAIRNPAIPLLDLGKQMVVRLDPGLAAGTLIYYDWGDGKYHVWNRDLAIR